MIEIVATLAFIGACLGSFLCAFLVLVNMFRAVANRKEGVPIFPSWYESPFNILFRPHQLTERGLRARRLCLYGFAGFWLFAMLAVAIGTLTGVAH
jgi:hypothetical protein